MKEFFVEFTPGKPKRLRYTSADGITLKKRFGKPLFNILIEDLIGMRREEFQPGKPITFDGRLMDRETQIVVLCLGLRHEDLRVTEERVMELLDGALGEQRSIADVILPAFKAVCYSGMLGESFDLDATIAEIEAKAAEGKEKGPAEAGPSGI